MAKFDHNQPDPILRNMSHSIPAIWLVPAVALVLGVLPLPYAYYPLLRIIVCIAAGFLVWKEYKLREASLSGFTFAFGAVAIIFNPIAPIYLTKFIWSFLDIVAAVVFVSHWWRCRI